MGLRFTLPAGVSAAVGDTRIKPVLYGCTVALDVLMSEARWTLGTESLPKVSVATKVYVKYDTGKIAYAVFHPEKPPPVCFSSNDCTCVGVASWQFLPTIDV